MSAVSQGAFVVIPKKSLCDISCIIKSNKHDLRNGGYLRRAGRFCFALFFYVIKFMLSNVSTRYSSTISLISISPLKMSYMIGTTSKVSAVA